jgi:hypothetical protein
MAVRPFSDSSNLCRSFVSLLARAAPEEHPLRGYCHRGSWRMRLTPHMDRSAPREWLSDPVSEFIEFMSQFCLQAFSRRPGRAPTPLVLLQRVMENEVHSSHGPFGIPGMAVRLFGIHRIYVAVLSAGFLAPPRKSTRATGIAIEGHGE